MGPASPPSKWPRCSRSCSFTDRRLALIFAQSDPTKGLAAANQLAGELEADHPDAAASLREGLDDMFTVACLGVAGALARTLTNTNCIESMISIAKRTTGRVTMEGRIHEETMDRRRHARSRALVRRYTVTRTWPSWSTPSGRQVTPAATTPDEYRSGSSLNKLWPPLNFNSERGNVLNLGAKGKSDHIGMALDSPEIPQP